LHSFAILAGLLFVSFGFTSAYADETFVDPDNLNPSFGYFIPRQGPAITDPQTGDAVNVVR